MNTYKLVIAYDGTHYQGWQIQPHAVTVAGTLQHYFTAIFKQPVSIMGASRTDAGVHALGQVVRLTTPLCIDAQKLVYVLNNNLPKAIFVRKAEQVSQDFNPRRYVVEKTYYYHIFKKRPLPFIIHYGYYPSYSIDYALLKQALQIFVGTHDFRSFCTGYYSSTVRTIDSIDLCYQPRLGAYRIIIKGPGFLRYMIRRIVGAALAVATGSQTCQSITAILQEKDPHQRLYTAPSCGLILSKIRYHTIKP